MEIHYFQGQKEIIIKKNPSDIMDYQEGIVNDSTRDDCNSDTTDYIAILNRVKDKVNELFNLKNLLFLFGSGTSNSAIPTMSTMYDKVVEKLSDDSQRDYFNHIVSQDHNLEHILNILYAQKTYLESITNDCHKQLNKCNKLIELIEGVIFDNINIKCDSKLSESTLENYKSFYAKVTLRSKDLSRVCVFTTNNDLFSETAMDSLNINYINGFGGGLKRYFNPALFNYSLSKRMDTSIDKFEPTENMIYLYKLHGSVNWVEEENSANSYFNIRQYSRLERKPSFPVLIYPNPNKQSMSLGAPYVDLFREFQNKLLLPNTVLFINGYSFSDQHVNNIIYRSLATNSSLTIFFFGKRKDSSDEPIFNIKDNRIYIAYGSDDSENNECVDNQINHFEYFVNNIVPNVDPFKDDDISLDTFVKSLKAASKQ